MSSRRRPASRRIVGLHTVTPRRTKPWAAPRRPKAAAKERGVPREFRDPPEQPERVLDECALEGCTNSLDGRRRDARHCLDAHRLKDWRDEQRRANAVKRTSAGTPRPIPHVAQVGPGVQDLPHVEDLRGLPHVAGLLGLPSDGLDAPDLEDPRVAGDDDDLDDRRRRARRDPEFRAWARQRGLL